MVDCQTAPIYALVCLLVALVLSVLAIAGGIVGCCGEQSNKKESRLEAAVPGARADDEPLIPCDRRLLVGSWFLFIPAGGLLYGAVHFAFHCP